MSKRSVTHNTFVIERIYPASPARVFAAWSQPQAKASWFNGSEEWELYEQGFDFRVGGREFNRAGQKGGPTHSFECLYHDIVPNKRIIFSYDMHLDDVHISVSLTTVELLPEDTSTRLIYTEQGVYLDGHEIPAEREHGMGELLDALGVFLKRSATPA